MTSNLSICIPLVSKEIPTSMFWNIFRKINVGALDRIDVVRKQKFNTVFVHLKKWHDTERSLLYKKKLMNGENLFISSFEKPIFWKCVLSRSTKPKIE